MWSPATPPSGGRRREQRGVTAPPSSSSIESVDEAKLHAPSSRADWIQRGRLVAALEQAARSPIVLVAAPAGFGKSTAVGQWLASPGAPPHQAWVSLDDGDNDPTRMWTHLATALDRAGCDLGDDPAEYVTQHAAAMATRVVPRLVSAIAELVAPVVLVLDDCHLLTVGPCADQLQRLLDHLPVNAHVIVISRSDPALRLGRLRVAGLVTEVRTADLAFDPGETRMMLRHEGVVASGSAVASLAERTEGWPAAVYLAALSLRGRSDPDEYIRQLSGSDRFLADYLAEEVLNGLSDELRQFVLDAVLFDRFCAALCDAVGDTNSAARHIRELERTNLFCSRVDAAGTWYRFHHLFASFARSIAEMEDPHRTRELHARGAEWFAQRGHVDDAVRHELAAGRPAAAAELIQGNWSRYFDAGRGMTVVGWLQRMKGLPEDDLITTSVTGAWLAALSGDRVELDRRLALLDAAASDGPLPDGTRSAASAAAIVRAMFGFDGPTALCVAAARAVELESDPRARWYATSRVTAGHASYLVGDLDGVRTMMADAVAGRSITMTVATLALSIWSLAESEAGNAVAARELAERAMALVRSRAMESVPQAGMAFTALGAAMVEQGDLQAAEQVCADGLRLRRLVPGLSPWPTVYHLLACARLAAERGRSSEAEELLAEAETLLPWDDPALARTLERIAAVRDLAERRSPVTSRLSGQLTPREREVLRRLTGTQSLQEIAVDLYVSRNTVKTITTSLYRKLGAHGREEAVTIARRQALL